jgi:metallo-beta-lactamase class B
MGTNAGGASAVVTRKNLQIWGCTFLLLLSSAVAAIGQSKIDQAKIGQVKTDQAMPPCSQCAEWNKPRAPFRIFGNSYYVGTHGLSSILVTSKAGHVLVDGDLPESAQQIVANIQLLGFHIEDVKIILNSHVHYDHAGGIAELQRLSGARVIASPWSAAVMKKGGVGRGDPQYGVLRPIAPIKNVHELRDGETFHVGEIAITAHLTPGHTPGGTSWTWKSYENNICHDMVYADSLTPVSADGFKFTASRDYPRALEDFEKSFTFLEATPCDILITTHPEASDLWDRLDGRQHGTTPDPMVNSGACRNLAGHDRELLHQRIAEEKPPENGKSR